MYRTKMFSISGNYDKPGCIPIFCRIDFGSPSFLVAHGVVSCSLIVKPIDEKEKSWTILLHHQDKDRQRRERQGWNNLRGPFQESISITLCHWSSQPDKSPWTWEGYLLLKRVSRWNTRKIWHLKQEYKILKNKV